jgi:hypothetical protein
VLLLHRKTVPCNVGMLLLPPPFWRCLIDFVFVGCVDDFLFVFCFFVLVFFVYLDSLCPTTGLMCYCHMTGGWMTFRGLCVARFWSVVLVEIGS